MAKKLISVWLSLTILLFSSISIYAGDNVRGDFFIRDIVINGIEIHNYQLDDPLFIYKNATYIPLTDGMGSIFGFSTEMDYESRTLNIYKTEPTRTDISEKWVKNNCEDINTQFVHDLTVKAYEPADPYAVLMATPVKAKSQSEKEKNQSGSDNLSGSETNANETKAAAYDEKKVELSGLPILSRGNVIYFPISAIISNDLFGWDTYYDPYTGVYISTKEGVEAESYFNEPRSRYNRGLVDYIKSYNSSYTTPKAQELVCIFRNASEIHDVDLTLLVSIAHKESTFNPNAKSSSGAIGLMQIMPATGKGYGLTTAQLYDPIINVDFGARYIKERIDAYGGDSSKALSAYNQGPGAVSRGAYTSRYANRVLGAEDDLKSYLSSNGYGAGE